MYIPHRTPIIVGNWKMNKTIDEAVALARTLLRELPPYQEIKKYETIIEVIITPPFTAISAVAKLLGRSPVISISAQDLFWEDCGAFTGEISAPLLKDAGAKYVIVGHSERRQLFHETNTTINKKIRASLKCGITPIFCIGETLAERESGKANEIITMQVSEGLAELTQKDITKTVVAYEPVWAIGTGKTATPKQAEDTHAAIRQLLAVKFGQKHADTIRILYGGSVNPGNVKELLAEPNIDGALVGGSSLKAEDFINIIRNIASFI